MMESLLAYKMARATGGGAPMAGGPEVKRGQDILEGPYPKSFAEFIGQERAKCQLIATQLSAIKRGKRMDHILLASGHPGIGKSSLARLTAATQGVGMVELGGTVTDKDAQRALRVMQDGDVLFLDEIHRMVATGKSRAEWLLTLLQDGHLATSKGIVQAPDITIIAASTDAQKLPETILDRFPVKPILDPYTDAEAVLIVESAARRLDFGSLVPFPDERDWLTDVARACDNNPRRVTQLLITVRDVALTTKCQNLTSRGYDISLALDWSGLSTDGLTKTAQDYLIYLYAVGGQAGIPSIKAALNEEQLKHTEAGLIQRGYVLVTSRGRELTEFGAQRALELVKAQMEA